MIVLAHAAAGSTWQALLVLITFGLIAVFVLAVAGRIELEVPGDLILPLAASAVLASLAGATNEFLSDWIGWWLPMGVVVLIALVLTATTSLTLDLCSPLTLATVVVALGAALALHAPIEDAWHPIDTTLRSDELAISITEPDDGATVPRGMVDVTVAIEGGTVGPDTTTGVGAVPEEDGHVRVYVDGNLVTNDDATPATPREDCSTGCTTVTFAAEVELGPHVISAEFLTADGRSFATTAAGAPSVDLVTVTGE